MMNQFCMVASDPERFNESGLMKACQAGNGNKYHDALVGHLWSEHKFCSITTNTSSPHYNFFF